MENITYPKITEYIDNRFNPLNERLMKIRLESEANFIPILQRDTEDLLRFLLQTCNPKSILEVGTCIGYSATVMAMVCPNSKIFTIERRPELVDEAQHNLDQEGLLDHVKVILGDGKKVLDEMEQKGEKFDFAFVDAGKSHYKEFCESIIKMMPTGGVILCDNILQRGMTVDSNLDPKGKHKTSKRRMNEFLDWIYEEPGISSTLLPVGDGVLICRIDGV